MEFKPLPPRPARRENDYSRGFISGALTEPQQSSEGGVSIFPWKVSSSEGLISLYPAVIVTTVASLYGQLLTNVPPPTYSPPISPFSFFARITLDFNSSFRYAVSDVDVVTDNDPDVIADFVGDEPPELQVIWEDPDTKEDGHFYIRIADIDVRIVSESVVITPEQLLFNSYRAFVIVGDGVVLIA